MTVWNRHIIRALTYIILREIDGAAEEVICLGFLLDIGNIREDVSGEYRKHLIYSMYARLWGNLQEDNSPLRAVVNGKLIGVAEDFYDFLILKRITGESIKEARLIGAILGNDQLGVGDWWYAKRIDHFIQTGKIKILEDSENKYARTICMT